MRIIGIDYGASRTGVAVSDELASWRTALKQYPIQAVKM